jgi:hypothetical protein
MPNRGMRRGDPQAKELKNSRYRFALASRIRGILSDSTSLRTASILRCPAPNDFLTRQSSLLGRRPMITLVVNQAMIANKGP